jgi:hypothetical protein
MSKLWLGGVPRTSSQANINMRGGYASMTNPFVTDLSSHDWARLQWRGLKAQPRDSCAGPLAYGATTSSLRAQCGPQT